MWRRFLQPLNFWGLLSAIVTLSRIWAARDSIPDISISVVTIMVWLIPKVALGGMVFFGGMLLTALFLWVRDLLRKGPSIRKFQALAQRVQECQSTLTEHYDRPRRGVSHAARFGVAYAQVELLLEDLRRLGIETPVFEHPDNLDDVRFLPTI